MLPELLFPVMQDISRDEFNILNSGGCANNDNPHPTSSTSILKSSSGTSTAESTISIKLEDVENWCENKSSLCNLLRNSEDPLISGATLGEMKRTIVPASPSPPLSQQPTTLKISKSLTSTTKQKSQKSTTNRVPKRKGQVKLRFHHQALPQEYLEHYEAAQNQINNNILHKNSKDELIDDELQNNISVRNWLSKITEIQEDEILNSSSLSSLNINVKNENNDIKTLATNTPTPTTTPSTQVTSSRICNYSDLPYMGEMTLENSKPRRGRKPKKADICHLIYKNYGQVLPGTPAKLDQKAIALKLSQKEQPALVPLPSESSSSKTNNGKNVIQNKILTSLLEKRLTNKDKFLTRQLLEQPLNLCLRDTKTVRSPKSPLSTSSSSSSVISSQSSIIIQNDIDLDTSLNFDLTESLDIKNDPILANDDEDMHQSDRDKKLLFSKNLIKSLKLKSESNVDELPKKLSPSTQNDLSYWKNSNVFLHPMALYYQKMIDLNQKNNLNRPSTSSNIPSTSSGSSSKLVAKNISELIQKRESLKSSSATPSSSKSNELHSPATTPSSIKSNESIFSTTSTSSNNNSQSSLKSVILSNNSSTTHPNQKRKRSAIFIPPMPSENTSNPTTEVSICKFKFTGGAKPSLQEKKMLSVDSGGNFRYYSGTGDKSMRGYEFFPRESLQQSSLMTGGSPSGVFLNTPGEKITVPDEPYPSLDLTNDVLQIPNLSPPISTSSLLDLCDNKKQSTSVSNAQLVKQIKVAPTTSNSAVTSNSNLLVDRKKRKSRRSIQREKLEKTFKEKGFLIQTQQLESAEGATYCKFRQLRRFTRYLFRSWKDYLPGDIQQSGQNQV